MRLGGKCKSLPFIIIYCKNVKYNITNSKTGFSNHYSFESTSVTLFCSKNNTAEFFHHLVSSLKRLSGLQEEKKQISIFVLCV